MQAQPPPTGSEGSPGGPQEINCPNCGGLNPIGATFCKWCGQAIIPAQGPNPGFQPPPAPPFPPQGAPPWAQGPMGSTGQGPFQGPSNFAPNVNAGGGCAQAFGRMLAQVVGDSLVESCCGLIGGILVISATGAMFLAVRKFARRKPYGYAQ